MPARRAICVCASLASTVAVLAPSATAATPGERDTSFGSHGFSFVGAVDKGFASNTRSAEGAAIVREPGGRLVAAVTYTNPNMRMGRFIGITTTVGLVRVT